jgi:ParB family chromosome partitioning protein
MKQQRLGKGLGALISDESASSSEAALAPGVRDIDVNEIDPNAAQPRKIFDAEALEGLAQSIKTYGIVQPIIVRRIADRYSIIAGERRYRAARLAGLKNVPVVIKDYSDAELMEVSLVENLQREDLNPIEEAQAMQLLMTEHSLTQEALSERLGKSRSAVANSLRLLSLPEGVRGMVETGALSSGHARCLVALKSDEVKLRLAKRIVAEGLSVRAVEELVKAYDGKPESRRKKQPVPEIESAEKALATALGTRVQITGDLKKGKIILTYYTADQLESLYDFLIAEK